MPGVLLLEDLRRANSDELNSHLQTLWSAPGGGYDPSNILPRVAPPGPPQPTTVDELQNHLDTIMPTVTPTPAPASTPAPAPTPVATPTPSSTTDELATHLNTVTGGTLNLVGQGLTNLQQAAPSVVGQGVTPLQAPTPPAPAPTTVFPLQQPSALEVTPTTAELSGGGPATRGLTDRARQIMAGAADLASWLGAEGQKALQAVLVTEGGMNNARGDNAYSAGPLQFFGEEGGRAGQLNNYAAARGLNLAQARNEAEVNPLEAVRWAIGTPDRPGYLGQAIANGQRQGLTGADLATYAQRRGQVSVSPERAGANYNALFAGGAAPLTTTAGLERAGVAEAAAAPAYRDISQFGDAQLTADEAYSACGPAAAVRFAQRYGRNPSLREALDLAKTVGWTQGQGMAGIASEKALMDRMDVATKLVSGPQWDVFAKEAQTGNPVTISTRGHYFTADGYDPNTGRFHVGRSGLDLRGGKEWMTAAEMTNLMGEVQGALLADNPSVPTTSTVSAAAPSAGTAPLESIEFTAPRTAPPVVTTPAPAPAPEESPLQVVGNVGAQVVQKAQDVGQGALRVLDDAVDTVARVGRQVAGVEPQAATPALAAPGMGYEIPRAPAVAPAEGGPLRQHVRALGMRPQPTIFEKPELIPPLLRGPGLFSDQELLQTASPEQLDTARQYARLTSGGREPTDAEIADVLRSYRTGMAAATHEGPGGAPRNIPGVPPRVRPSEPLIEAAAVTRPTEAPRPPELIIPGQRPASIESVEILGPRGETISRVERPTPTEAPIPAEVRVERFPAPLRPDIEAAARRAPEPEAARPTDPVSQSVGDWFGATKVREAHTPEETLALRSVVTNQTRTVQQLADNVETSLRRGTVNDRDVAQAIVEGQKLEGAIRTAEGRRGEWSPGGKAWQAQERYAQMTPEEIVNDVFGKLGGTENARRAVTEFNELLRLGAGPEATAKYWAGIRTADKITGADWFSALRYNSMLSGPRTFEVALAGNLANMLWRLPRDVVASIASRQPGGLLGELLGLVYGTSYGARGMGQVIRLGVSQRAALQGDIPRSLAARAQTPVAQGAATVLESTGRGMEAIDEFVRAWAEKTFEGRRAGLQASKEGLQGRAWVDRVRELIDEPTPAMRREASAVAERVVLKGDMGALGTALAGVQRVPFAGPLLIPFVRTTYHGLMRGLDITPGLGTAKLAMDIGLGRYGNLLNRMNREYQMSTGIGPGRGLAPLGERVGDQVIGSALLMGYLLPQAFGTSNDPMSATITGAGPKDREKRDMLQAQGWRPYSIRVPDGVPFYGGTYVSYANWTPVNLLLATAAAIAESEFYRKDYNQDAFTRFANIAERTGKVTSRMFVMQQIGDMIQAWEDPQRGWPKVIAGFATAQIPFGAALATAGETFDPYQREVGKPGQIGLGQYLVESVKARVPGLREQLPIAQEQLGRPMLNEAAGAAALQPFRLARVRADAVLNELVASGVDIGEPPTTLGPISITREESRRFNEMAGQYIIDDVTAYMSDPKHARWTTDQKRDDLADIVRDARRDAGKAVLGEMSDAEYNRRFAEAEAKKVPVPIGVR